MTYWALFQAVETRAAKELARKLMEKFGYEAVASEEEINAVVELNLAAEQWPMECVA